ncbi:MAG: hypothetical protein V4690_00615 [Patescibacteria group bacterium]
MELSNRLKQKASNGLVLFVLACTIIIVGLLYVMQKAEATREHLNEQSDFESYLN